MGNASKLSEWDKAQGVLCPCCGQETHRLLTIAGARKCLACFRKAEVRQDQEVEMKALVRSLRRSRSSDKKQ